MSFLYPFTRKKKPLSYRPSNMARNNFVAANVSNPMVHKNIKPKFDALFAANRASSIEKLRTAVQPITELYKSPDGAKLLNLYFDRERSPSRNILRKFSDEDLASLKHFAKGLTILNNNTNAIGGSRTRKGNRKTRRTRK